MIEILEEKEENKKPEKLTLNEWFMGEECSKSLRAALGPDVDVKKYIRGVLTTIQTTENLRQCTPASVIKSVLMSAQIGLSVDARQHAFLIPRFNKELQKFEATFMPGYKGYIHKIRVSGKVLALYIEAVYRGDKFEVYRGTEPKIVHISDIESEQKPEDITHFYAMVKMTNGETEFEVMTKSQVNEIKSRAQTQMVWGKNYQQMGRKTTLLRLMQRLQLPETSEMVQVDNAYHEGRDVKFEDGVVIVDEEKDKYLDNEHMDHSMTPEKEDVISKIKRHYVRLKYNSSKQLKYQNKYLMVAELEHAKKVNLDVLYRVLFAMEVDLDDNLGHKPPLDEKMLVESNEARTK